MALNMALSALLDTLKQMAAESDNTVDDSLVETLEAELPKIVDLLAAKLNG